VHQAGCNGQVTGSCCCITTQCAMEPWKYVLVAFLVSAISSKNLVTKASQDGNTKMPYLFFSLSMFVEAFKLFISCCMYLHHYLRGSAAETPDPDDKRPELVGWKENLLLCVPAIIFAITNNMYFLIIERLDPATISLLWNLKIIGTGCLLWLIGSTITHRQWGGMCLLLLGVFTTQIDHLRDGLTDHKSRSEGAAHQSYMTGVALCLVAVALVTCGCVLCEYVYKRTQANQYRQYINMYTAGVLVNAVCLVVKDMETIQAGGVFQGWNVWTCICVFSLGGAGFLVGAAFKHLDNIAVVFCDVGATIVVAVFSFLFFDLQISVTFVLGGIICCGATYVYYIDPTTPAAKTATSPLPTEPEIQLAKENAFLLEDGESHE